MKGLPCKLLYRRFADRKTLETSHAPPKCAPSRFKSCRSAPGNIMVSFWPLWRCRNWYASCCVILRFEEMLSSPWGSRQNLNSSFNCLLSFSDRVVGMYPLLIGVNISRRNKGIRYLRSQSSKWVNVIPFLSKKTQPFWSLLSFCRWVENSAASKESGYLHKVDKAVVHALPPTLICTICSLDGLSSSITSSSFLCSPTPFS